MVNGADQRERRIVRRRLVQSTLFPHKSPEIEPKVDQKAKTGEDDNNDGEDEEFCGSQGEKKGRKRKGKVIPQNRASKKAKEKSPMKTTPKKNGMNNLIESEDASPPPIPNLRLEAKLTADENSRMFAGRQIHPFFTSLKAGKKSQETAELGENGCLFDRSNKGINIGPIHVFERTQNDVVLDWQGWTFFEKTSIDTDCNLEGLFTSVFESCVGALCLGNFPGVSHFSDASFVQNKLSDQCIIQDNGLLGTSMAVPALLVDEQLKSYQQLKGSEGADNVESSEFEQQSRLLKESGCGFVPCYHGCSIQLDNSLWTDKYQPKNAREVCGNAESVKFMSEWLHLWRERSFQAIKVFNNNGKSNMQEDDDDFCESDFDSENTDGGDSLKNVLLVTGPIGSGKSAAIHACAKEQGFKVLESNASDCRNGAVVKQKFGEALKSHCLTGSLENPVDSLSKHVMKFAGPLSNSEAVQQFDNEVIPISDEEDPFGAHGASGKRVCNDSETGIGQAKAKALILFEDVDISFPEDRGFAAAVKQIAEKAKGPVILTSNSNNLVLPDNLDRLELCFTMPSQEELLHYIYMVCAAEKATIQPHLLEQLIKCCKGDIRKTIMHLQFWCQSKQYQKDEDFNKQPSVVSDKNVNRELFIEKDCRLLSHCSNCIRPLIDELLCSEVEKHKDRGFQGLETENNLQVETCNSVDVSYVPETEIGDGMELSSTAVSNVNVAETMEVSVSCKFTEDLLPVESNDPGKFIHKLVKTSEMLGGTCSITAEASPEEVVEHSQNEYDEVVSSGHPVMDECGCMNFNKRSFSLGKFNNQGVTDLVQESWKKLRDSHADIKHYAELEPIDALKILKLTSRMSDLISQADQLLSKCQMQDSLELLMLPSENSDAFSWCDEQLQMANTVSQHGFCLYAKEIDTIGSNMGFELRVDLSQEMLASSTSTMVLGRLFGHDARASRNSVDGKVLDMSPSNHELAVKRDVKSCLFNIIRSIVPSRLYLALNSAAFHEYISTLGCISRSEASRLSAGMGFTKRRRTRGARHYLSTGANISRK
ncbi:uncharacterized protein LOC111298179 isoform X2 [Durio zibethinus]|uniref:Uncharacterized protein LOC111298179 isoform X2 n=1 Tax=Durio zibethinus TaxID=66656 RepID=A0A6P5Z7D4_DURZI|nr:uncharacterized protein LOC111298179 isoform X2 [Durio zibethinus]